MVLNVCIKWFFYIVLNEQIKLYSKKIKWYQIKI